MSVLHLIADHIAALFLLGFDQVHVECSLGQVQSSHNIIGGSLILDLKEVRIHELATEIGTIGSTLTDTFSDCLIPTQHCLDSGDFALLPVSSKLHEHHHFS